MNDGRPPRVSAMRVVLIVSAATAFSAGMIALARIPLAAKPAPEANAALITPPVSGIAAEAQVFRTRSGVLAIDPTPGPRRDAHPRTLATYRVLRAYPGAPPRIPHGLTPSEFQHENCRTCHERGGWSDRFGAYVPVTPHPELGACLQCHVGTDQLMAVPLPQTDPSARCRQCHTPGSMKWRDSSLTWNPLPWPQIADITAGRTPPPIPHRLQMRENCLTCHAPPSGVAELRTPHSERANCRQCHVEGGS